MPTMYNPDTKETVEASGQEVEEREAAGFVIVGNRPRAEYEGRTREELLADGHYAGTTSKVDPDAARDPSPMPNTGNQQEDGSSR